MKRDVKYRMADRAYRRAMRKHSGASSFWTVVTVALTAMWLLLGWLVVDDIQRRVSTTSVVCMEDQACWDCSAMGNHICGEAQR